MEELAVNIYHWKQLDPEQREALCSRVEAAVPPEVTDVVNEVIEAVRDEGDAAVIRYTEKFDRADLSGKPLRAGEEEFQASEGNLSEELKQAIAFAVQSVRRVHEEQRPGCLELCEVRPGVFAGERYTPIPSAGLYVPRGRGSFPSVMYMQVIPATIAGVKRIVAVSPPDGRGTIDPACLYTAKICGVEEVYRVGGIQGIAALAFGTESIPKVDKILGPGSLYVAAAKRALADRVDVGLPAGPSEAIVLADDTANPRRVAVDLITEAEHGSDSSAFLVTPSAGGNCTEGAAGTSGRARPLESRVCPGCADRLRGHRGHRNTGGSDRFRQPLRPRAPPDRLPGALHPAQPDRKRRRDPVGTGQRLLHGQLRGGLQQRDSHGRLGQDLLPPVGSDVSQILLGGLRDIPRSFHPNRSGGRSGGVRGLLRPRPGRAPPREPRHVMVLPLIYNNN